MLNEDELKKINHMLFLIFFSILMFVNLYTIDFHAAFNPHLLLLVAGLIVAITGIAAIVVNTALSDNATRGAILHGMYRSNFIFMGWPLVQNLVGVDNMHVVTVLIIVVVPLYNLLGVIVLESYRGGKVALVPVLKGIMRNAMLVGAAIGLVLNLAGVRLPAVLLDPLVSIHHATGTVALVLLGANINFSTIGECVRPLIAAVFGRLVIVPSVALTVAALAGYRGVELASLLAVFCTPTAVVTYTMAVSMQSNYKLAANIVVFTSFFSLFTLVFWIFILKTLALI